MLKQYMSMLNNSFRSYRTEKPGGRVGRNTGQPFVTGNLFVVGSNSGIGLVKFFFVIRARVSIEVRNSVYFNFFLVYRQNSKFPRVFWRCLLPK